VTSKKQQILFIGRKIWNGGAEKVMYYLSHQLDRDLFEPHVAYMIRQEDAPVVYDSSIKTYSADPNPVNHEAPKNLQGKGSVKLRFPAKLYTRVKSKIKSFLRKKNTKLQILLSPEGSAPQIKSEALPGFSVLSNSLSIPYVYSCEYDQILSKLDPDAIIVAFQEEPTVQAWLNQINHSYSYISYLCAPESIHLPLLYPESRRLKVEKWMFSNACRSADYVTVPNTWMYHDMVEEFATPADKVKIIPNPVDCNLIVQKSQLPLEINMDLAGKTVFVQLARLDPQKNHTLTMDACEILKRSYDNFVVLLIGDGTERSRLEQLVIEKKLEKHVVFLGDQSNPYPYLKIARSSLLTSNFEASPLALIDAMLLGAVPISVDCISGPSDILGDGRYGLLVPPGDPQKFSDAMLRMAKDDDLWRQLKGLGMKHAYSFDISLFVDAWTKLLLEIQGRNKFPRDR
jgi:glycosyltransferase involved in cell wall biosynthesis